MSPRSAASPDSPGSPAPAITTPGRLEHLLALLCLLGALVWQIQAVTISWSSTALPGNSFRQTQTAHSTHFIIAEDNYDLAYPTPILGRPWSIPMEFPLYQWTVAWITQHGDLSMTEVARTVSLVCFYATLPAFWLLLGLAGVPVARRWWCLIPVLLSPVNILYGRAFLIETMALCFAAWFVLSFALMLRRRSLCWLVATGVFGALAGLTKATTLLAAGLPCAAIGLTPFIRALRERNPREALVLVGWGAAAALPAFIATWWWTHFADATKALNPIGRILRSDNLTGFNFGQNLFADRFSIDRWTQLARQWELGLLPPLLIVVLALIAATLAGRLRWAALLCLATFLGTQAIFPNLYSIHDYYFVAIAGVAALGWGLALSGLAERSRWTRLPALGLLALVAGLQIQTFNEHYRAGMVRGSSGDNLTNGLLQLTEDNEVLIIAGDEWSSVIPYYAQRRALMLAFGTIYDPAVLDEAFAKLDPNEVAGLVLVRDQRGNDALVEHVMRAFDITREPMLRLDYADVYFTQRVMSELLPADANPNDVGGDPVQVYADTMKGATVETANLTKRQQRLFANLSPLPDRFYFEFGPAVLNTTDGMLINAHPTTRLWFTPPPGATSLLVEYGMFDSVWQNDYMDTDGATLIVERLAADGTVENLFQRHINPRGNEAHRPMQILRLPLQLAPDDKLLIRSDPGPEGRKNFDWFYIRDIVIE
ncbi:ArnT family glycosyltransferase [Actomonas aquatica]|uniref:Glycosyltransferase family 39 protein n=1 Tax=Actomonas aquatica TaxID=2866162 RepID=A0ABZ1C707_9BACT|nr:glycosyltransferase family 39 protein [Opitutus sp. WL0086]WRQ87491.1 glycosyltransferase family 39 protein [Opitutus sp. WL0086]